MRAFEFWAKRRDERGHEIDVTVIAYDDTAEGARAKVDALGVHYDVAAFEPLSEFL